jgi:hypothetical protein
MTWKHGEPDRVALATSLYDHQMLTRTGAFALGTGLLLLVWLGHANWKIGTAACELLTRQAQAIPLAALLGALLSVFAFWRLRKHYNVYAGVEDERRAVGRNPWSFAVFGNDGDGWSAHGRTLWLDWLVHVVSALIFLTGTGSVEAVLLWPIVFGTECLCWYVLWRPRVRRSVAASDAWPRASGAIRPASTS